MGKFSGVLICADCDGTLMDDKKIISKKNSEAIKYFQDEGGYFTLATGRFPWHANNYKDSISVNAPVVSLNGVMVYDLEKEKTIRFTPMNTDEAFEVLKYLNENHVGIWEYWLNFNGLESACYKPFDDKFESESLKVNLESECNAILRNHAPEEKKVFEYISSRVPKETAKNVFVMPDDMLPAVQKDLREKFGERFRFDSSWPNGLEMQDRNSSKGDAVQFLKNYLGDVNMVICIGDYENDISMIRTADRGYAVKNAADIVKKEADVITLSDNNEDAVFELINDLENFICGC